MPGTIELRYEHGTIHEYQKDMLSLEVCEVFLQQVFVDGQERDMATTHMEDFCPILSVEALSGDDVIVLMISLLRGMMEAENHCFFVGEYRVDSTVLCVSQAQKKSALVYVPQRYTSQVALYQDLIQTFTYMQQKCPEEERRIVGEGIAYLQRGYGDFNMLCQRLELLRKKYCRP